MTDPLNFDCDHGIPSGFEPEIFMENTEILRCPAYLLSVDRQCQGLAKEGGGYCGWHSEPLVTRACGICKKKRQAEAVIQKERKEAERLQRLKNRVPRVPSAPNNSRRLTDSEKKQIKDQREQRDIYDSQLREAASMLDEHLSNSESREFDRGLKLALDGDVEAGIEIMRAAREQMNAQSFDDSAMLALLEMPKYTLGIDHVVSMATVLDVMTEYMALAFQVIPSASGRGWFVGKLRDKFGK